MLQKNTFGVSNIFFFREFLGAVFLKLYPYDAVRVIVMDSLDIT